MPPNIEAIKHIGNLVDGKMVCIPNCPSITHKKNTMLKKTNGVTGEVTMVPTPTKERKTVEEVVEEFDKLYVEHCSDGEILDGMVDAKKVKKWLRNILQTEREYQREELEEAIRVERLKHCCCLIENGVVAESCKLHADAKKKELERLVGLILNELKDHNETWVRELELHIAAFNIDVK